MSEPKKSVPPAFRTVWSTQPLSYVYYLVLWGVPEKKARQVLHDLLPGRTEDSITSIVFKVRSYITVKKSGEDRPGWMQKGFIKRMDAVAKMPPSSNVARFKEEGTGFKPAVFHGKHKGRAALISMDATPDNLITTNPADLEPESPFKHQRLVRTLQPPMTSLGDQGPNPERKEFVDTQKAPELPPQTSYQYEWNGPNMNEAQQPHSVLEEIKALVAFARGLGATEVEYKDVKIKF